MQDVNYNVCMVKILKVITCSKVSNASKNKKIDSPMVWYMLVPTL